MKKSILAITLFAFVASAIYITGCTQNKKEENTHEHMQKIESEATAYSCPMHPEVTGEQTDKCSKCGMTLTKTKSSETGDHNIHK